MAPDRSQRRTRVRREKKKGGQETVSKQERGGGDESVEGSVGN